MVAADSGVDADRFECRGVERPERARRIVGEIAPSQRDRALMTLTGHSARLGHPEDSEQFARSIEKPFWQAEGLVAATLAWMDAGQRQRATRVLGEIEEAAQAQAQTDFGSAPELAAIARNEATYGRYGRACAIAELIAATDRRISTWLAIAGVAANDNQAEYASQFFRNAQDTADRVSIPWSRAIALQAVASAAWSTGDHDKAVLLSDEVERFAHTLDATEDQVRALSDIAIAATSAADVARGRRLLHEIDQFARGIGDPDDVLAADRALSCVALARYRTTRPG